MVVAMVSFRFCCSQFRRQAENPKCDLIARKAARKSPAADGHDTGLGMMENDGLEVSNFLDSFRRVLGTDSTIVEKSIGLRFPDVLVTACPVATHKLI